MALLSSRLQLITTELKNILKVLSKWFLDKNESKIVRVNSLQALSTLSFGLEHLEVELERIIQSVLNENIPSINARLRKLKADGNSENGKC